ncbi:MAG: hypothetical protein WAQ99_21865 [Pyrinomonadaceae bacterium]
MVLDGKVTPEEGASRIASHWAPKEFLKKSESVPLLVQTRGDSLATLDLSVIDLTNEGLHDQARRLAEMNWVFAKRAADEDLMVQCGSTLAQVMIGDPGSSRERLALLEFAVPKVVESQRSDEIKAVMLAHLADARFTEIADHPESVQAAIDACLKSLALNPPLPDYWLGRLNFIAGTAYNKLGDIEALQASISYFKAALRYYRVEEYPPEHASTLNNLGNSCRDLGINTTNPNLLREAIAYYEQAMPLRKLENLRFRTQRNLTAAQEALAALDRMAESVNGARPDRASSSTRANVLVQFKELLTAGDDAFHSSQVEKEKCGQFRRRAAEKYIEWMSVYGTTAALTDRAEAFHRLAALFLDSVEDDALCTGLCFASTAQRLGRDGWGPLGQARVASHRGQLLMRIGYPNNLPYLLSAESCLRNSIAPLQEFGQPGEAEQAGLYLKATDDLLAANNVADAEHRVAARCSSEAMQRLESQAGTKSIDDLHKTYYEYFSVVRKTAMTELADLLGQLGLERTRANLDVVFDEFNRAFQFVQIAAKHREIGDLDGAISLAEEAEVFAQSARYSAPLIWCELARFYLLIPLSDQALRCVERAQDVMSMVAEEGVYVAEDEGRGRWMPETTAESYQLEIDETKALIPLTPSTPCFDPARTAELLAPKDRFHQQTIQQAIQTVAERAGLDGEQS